MTDWIRYEIPLRPIVKKNRRTIYKNKKGNLFIGKEEGLISYEADAKVLLQSQKNCRGLKTLEGIIEARFLFLFQEECRADGDNLLSTALDAAQTAQLIKNDSLVKKCQYEVVEHTNRPSKTVMEFRNI